MPSNQTTTQAPTTTNTMSNLSNFSQGAKTDYEKAMLDALVDRSWAISPMGTPFAPSSRPVSKSSRKSKKTSSEKPQLRDQVPKSVLDSLEDRTWAMSPMGTPFATSSRPATSSRSPSQKPESTYASSTYSTSTTMTEKPLLASSEKSSRWSKTKKFLSMGEPPAAEYEREQAAKGNKPDSMPVLVFNPFNDRRQFPGRL